MSASETKDTKEARDNDLKLSNEESVQKTTEEKKDSKAQVKDKTIKIKQSEYDTLLKTASEYKDKYLRLYAEFDNARKRMEKEKLDFIKYANEGVFIEFLNILDNLERTVVAAEKRNESDEAFLKGVEMVMAQIHDMLKKNNVKAIEAKGKVFDPHCHEVLMQEETDVVEEGVVLEEFQKGYMYGDRVIRTVKVKVAKAKENVGEIIEENKDEKSNS